MSDGIIYAIFTVGNAPTDKKERAGRKKPASQPATEQSDMPKRKYGPDPIYTPEEKKQINRDRAKAYYEKNRYECIQKNADRIKAKRLATGVPVRIYRKRNLPTENNLAETENKQEV
jgi:hypothetical protein